MNKVLPVTNGYIACRDICQPLLTFSLEKLRFNAEAFLNILLSTTNKMQLCTIFFIIVNAVHVSGGFSALHQELKTVNTACGICQACLLLLLAVAASKPGTYQMLCVQFLSS
jgi:hypothetical protein